MYHKWRSYDTWFLKYKVQQKEIFVILGHFFPFPHPDNPENQNFKLKKTPPDIIILHICTINDYHLMYGCWNMERNRQNFCHSGTFFALFPPQDKGNQNFGKMNTAPEDIIILPMCIINDNHMMCHSWDMEHDGQNFLSFWTIFCTLTPLTTQKAKFWKNEKKLGRYYHFTHVYHKWQSSDVWFVRYGSWQTEFFVILDLLLPFYPPNNPKNEVFKNEKNTWGYYQFTHVHHKYQSYDVYGSWYTERDRTFCYFWPFFALLPP